ncbi:hypothetical protein TB2_034128 [Malus domestica]
MCVCARACVRVRACVDSCREEETLLNPSLPLRAG